MITPCRQLYVQRSTMDKLQKHENLTLKQEFAGGIKSTVVN